VKHDVEITELEIDEQSTVWLMKCKRCGRMARPIQRKDEAQEALDESSCPGPKDD